MKSDRDEQRNQPVGTGRPRSAFARMERVPPLQMFLYLGMVGITVLFGVLLVLYVQTRLRSGVASGLHPFPRFFSISTVVLLVSSYTLSQAPRLYREDDLPNLTRCLGATLVLALIFAGLQVLGWVDLKSQGVYFTGATATASGSYVYLIPALHVLHLLGGVLFLLALLIRTVHASRDGIRTLVFIRNPYRRQQLRLLTTYWHFIDALWVVLFGVFLFLY